MLGRGSVTYKSWINEHKRYEKMAYPLSYANFGSTCDANNYDYKYWDEKGFNFAASPQDMYYDNQLLEQYGHRLKKGGYVFINISEFAFLTDSYDEDYHNHKYYWLLNSTRIINYSKRKSILLRYAPGFIDIKYVKIEVKSIIKKLIYLIKENDNSKQSLEKMSSIFYSSWMKEFGWEDDIQLRNDQIERINNSWNIFLKDVEYCKLNQLIPVVVIPPFSVHLKKLLPSYILDKCLWKYIHQIENMGIKVIDFWNSDILDDDKFYTTPILLNEEGKKIFNMTLQKKLMKESTNKKTRSQDYFTLVTGETLPSLAFGTGVIKRFYRNKTLYLKDICKALLISIVRKKLVRFLKNDFTICKTLDNAFKSGYRFFDTGRLYGHSEKYIGEVLHKYNRNEYYILTKVSDVDLKRYPGKNTVHDNLEISLNMLKTNYVDAYLLHFPTGNWLAMYKDLEREYQLGRTKSIGVCNFDLVELKELVSKASIKPMICQIEVHPLNNKRALINFCHENGIVVMAHTPTGHMSEKIIGCKDFNDIMKRHNKNAAQIIYRWHYQNGVIPIVSSVSKKHINSNLDIYNFELNDREMALIDSIDEGYSFDPKNNKDNDCPDFIYNI